MDEFIVYNGDLLPKDQFGLSYHNRSFRYGDGVFESIRCYKGYPLWIKYHFDRLIKSAAVLKLKLPVFFTQDAIESLIRSLLKSNRHSPHARVRITMFRADGGLYKPADHTARLIIESAALEDDNYLLNTNGINAGIFRDITKTVNPISKLKTTSALLYVLASVYATEQGWDDIILLNDDGFVAEAGSSNIFMVSKGKLYTPALDQGCVDGVMRRLMLDITAIHGLSVCECAILPDDLLKAEEVFITNAVKGIQWIKGLESKRYYHDIASRLMGLLQVETQNYIVDKNP